MSLLFVPTRGEFKNGTEEAPISIQFLVEQSDGSLVEKPFDELTATTARKYPIVQQPEPQASSGTGDSANDDDT
jgi:hypothetical protein